MRTASHSSQALMPTKCTASCWSLQTHGLARRLHFQEEIRGSSFSQIGVPRRIEGRLSVMTHATLIDLFMEALGQTVIENIKKPGMKLLDPVQEAIKAIPVPGLDEFLNVESMFDDVLNDSMVELLKGILEKPLEAGQAELSAVSV